MLDKKVIFPQTIAIQSWQRENTRESSIINFDFMKSMMTFLTWLVSKIVMCWVYPISEDWLYWVGIRVVVPMLVVVGMHLLLMLGFAL